MPSNIRLPSRIHFELQCAVVTKKSFVCFENSVLWHIRDKRVRGSVYIIHDGAANFRKRLRPGKHVVVPPTFLIIIIVIHSALRRRRKIKAWFSSRQTTSVESRGFSIKRRAYVAATCMTRRRARWSWLHTRHHDSRLN